MVEFLTSSDAGWGWPLWLAHLVVALVKVGLLLQIPAVGALVFIWMERKIAGRIQDRLGPTRVGGAFGWLQTLADGIKLIAKEDITPGDADRFLFKLAPYVGFAAAFAALLAIPFSAHFVAVEINVGIFFVLAVLGLEVFGVILAGYASGSKWALFGAMREAAQVVSYEVPLGLCVIVPVMICGSMNLITIGQMQAGGLHTWLVFHDPFTFCVAIIYFTCATASVNRAPFDLAEAESELVAGFHTEYSGLRWSFFFMAEYGSMFTVSALAAILFFGAWNGPIPFGITYGEGTAGWLWGLFGDFLGVNCLLIKAIIGVTVMMWVRWTLPRLRIDQVITTCLKYCVPLAAICFVGVLLVQINFLNVCGLASVDYWVDTGRAEVREGWAQRRMAARQSASSPEEATSGAGSQFTRKADAQVISRADFQVRQETIAGAQRDGLGSPSYEGGDAELLAKGGAE